MAHVLQLLTDLNAGALVVSVDGVGVFDLVSRAMLNGLFDMSDVRTSGHFLWLLRKVSVRLVCLLLPGQPWSHATHSRPAPKSRAVAKGVFTASSPAVRSASGRSTATTRAAQSLPPTSFAGSCLGLNRIILGKNKRSFHPRVAFISSSAAAPATSLSEPLELQT